jgi:phospho-N-acetylmuramoyl-pentapeptide-transferase
MGGVLMLASIVISSLLWLQPTSIIGWILLGGTVLFGLLGFADEALKVFRQDRDGLPEKPKLIGQFVIAGIAVTALCFTPETAALMKQFYVPFLKTPLFTGSIFIPAFSVLAIVSMVNAVNFTDGKDGLASGCTIFCMITYAILTYLMGHRVFADYLNIPHLTGIEEAVIFSAATAGACLGFLWHNCHPAAMFMGDTGSLALGGIVGMMAVLTRQELLLILVGGIFVMEALSVMIQVASVKLTGKRVFYCSPFHHHFEHLGWTETQIVVRFWIIAGILALSALATLKLR